MYRVDQKKCDLKKNGHNSSEIHHKRKKFMCFYAFFKGVANFKFIFLSHFSTNFERFGAYPAAFMLNFPKHTNFFPFWWISEELWPFFFRSHFFLVHPVYTSLWKLWRYGNAMTSWHGIISLKEWYRSLGLNDHQDVFIFNIPRM